MELDFSNHDKDLVKLVCSAIFNDNVARTQDLKDLAYDNGYNEDEVHGILDVLKYEECITFSTTGMFNNDFMPRNEYKYKLINQGLL